VKTNNSETRLLEYILDGYNREVRPIKNISEPVKVRMGLNLKQIISVVGTLAKDVFKVFDILKNVHCHAIAHNKSYYS